MGGYRGLCDTRPASRAQTLGRARCRAFDSPVGSRRDQVAPRSGFGARRPVAPIMPRAPSSAPARVRARAAGAFDTDRASRAGRSARPKSRTARNRARRRPEGWRRGRACARPRSRGASACRRCRGCGARARPQAVRAAAPAAGAGRHVPKPHGADDAPALGRNERQPAAGRRSSRSRCEHLVNGPRHRRGRAALARVVVGKSFLANGDHGHPSFRRPVALQARDAALSGDRIK